MRRLCYITRNYKTTAHGGGKGRVDSEDIMADMGAVNLGIKRSFHGNKIIDFLLTFAGIARYAFAVRSGDVIVLQYPVKKYYRFICRWAHLRGASVITLVHDLGSFRRKRLTVDEEIKKLSLSDVLIAANANTVAWLRGNGYRKPVVEQVAWDFLSDAVPAGGSWPETSCAFVGNLSSATNGFLYKLPDGMPLYLYGGGADREGKEGTEIFGFELPDDLIRNMKGRYGLIWYGSDTDKTVGYIGEYIAYCNSHKMALYMRAWKPVLLWKGAGAAPFVEKEDIGLCVDTLTDLDKQLRAISPERYEQMCGNVRRVSDLMAHGHFLRTAIGKALKHIPAVD